MLLNSVRLICFEICRLQLHFLRNDACRSFSISEFGLYIQKTNSLSVMLLLHICFGLSNSCVVIKGSALLQLALHHPAVSVVHRQSINWQKRMKRHWLGWNRWMEITVKFTQGLLVFTRLPVLMIKNFGCVHLLPKIKFSVFSYLFIYYFSSGEVCGFVDIGEGGVSILAWKLCMLSISGSAVPQYRPQIDRTHTHKGYKKLMDRSLFMYV